MISLLRVLVVLLTVGSIRNEDGSAERGNKIPLNILVMVPWPDARDISETGWDAGLELLTAGRVAVKQINERDEYLKDYELNLTATGHEPCAFTESLSSLSNLVYHAVSPGRKVLAVLGLYCSTSTVFLSQLAGSSGVDLLHLSAANSPVFNLDYYPRLWRFLQSAAVFGEAVLDMMDQFDWQTIGLVQDLKSVFYVGMAQAFVDAIHPDNGRNKTLGYHGGLVETDFVDETLDEIRQSKVRIIYVTATETQAIRLVCSAQEKGMAFPDYVWIVADYRVENLIDTNKDFNVFKGCDIGEALRGSILMYSILEAEMDSAIIQPANISYKEYSDQYAEELELVKKDYAELLSETGDTLSDPDSDDGNKEYAGILYDQVWALTVALENALPELKRKNISIEDYGFNNSIVTDILESYLRNISFKGVSGQMRFSDKKEVGTPVQVYQIMYMNSTEDSIGTCEINNKTGRFHCDVKLTSTNFDDMVESKIVKFLSAWTVVLVLIISTVLIVITIILCLMIRYRAKPEVKATSPMLSMVMFCGCYFLCFAALVHGLLIMFNIPITVSSVGCNLEVFLAVNGANLIFVTLFMKLFRISRIFNNNDLSHLSWVYSSYSLLAIALILSVLPDIILIVMFSYDPLEWQKSKVYRASYGVLQYDVYYYCYSSKFPPLWLSLVFGYLSIFIGSIVYLAITTRNIQNEHFKDTKKVNFFIFLTIIAFGIPIPCSILLLYAGDSYLIGNAIIIFGFLILASLNQVMLFMPKVFPIAFGLQYHKVAASSKWRRASMALRKNSSSFMF